MRFGSGIKDSKGEVWAQALRPALLPGESIVLLVKGNLGGLTDDLTAVTNLRLLTAQTAQHCRVRGELHLDEIRSAAPAGSRVGRKGVTLTLRNGEQRRLTLSAMRAGDDEAVVADTVNALLRAEMAPELRSARDADQAARVEHSARLEAAKQGRWPQGVVVVGSRPRAKGAETIVAHCRPGEIPWLIIASLGEGVLAAFDDRLIIVKTGAITAFQAGALGGGRVTTFPYDHVTGIEYNSGLLTGVLEILTPSYSGTENKDYWRGLGRNPNSDVNNPRALSNTLPLDKPTHAQALPHLNELRQRISQSKRVHVTVEQPVPASAPAPAGLAEQLAQLAQLRDAGALDDAEFSAAKQRLLGQ